MKVIRAAWLVAFACAVVGWGLPPSQSIFILVPVMVLCLTAWGAAICRAARRGEMGWVCLIALMPSITMWFYIFRRDESPRHLAPLQPRSPTRRPRPPAEGEIPDGAIPRLPPLAVRQALETIRDAEQRYPEW